MNNKFDNIKPTHTEIMLAQLNVEMESFYIPQRGGAVIDAVSSGRVK